MQHLIVKNIGGSPSIVALLAFIVRLHPGVGYDVGDGVPLLHVDLPETNIVWVFNLLLTKRYSIHLITDFWWKTSKLSWFSIPIIKLLMEMLSFRFSTTYVPFCSYIRRLLLPIEKGDIHLST